MHEIAKNDLVSLRFHSNYCWLCYCYQMILHSNSRCLKESGWRFLYELEIDSGHSSSRIDSTKVLFISLAVTIVPTMMTTFLVNCVAIVVAAARTLARLMID